MESAYFDDHPYHETPEAPHTESAVLESAELDPEQLEALELAQEIVEQQIVVQKLTSDLDLAQDLLSGIHTSVNRGEEITADQIGTANHEVDRLFSKAVEARRKLHKLEVRFKELNGDSPTI